MIRWYVLEGETGDWMNVKAGDTREGLLMVENIGRTPMVNLWARVEDGVASTVMVKRGKKSGTWGTKLFLGTLEAQECARFLIRHTATGLEGRAGGVRVE